MNTGFGWILLAIAIYGALHSLLAGGWAKERAAHWFGQAGRRWYRLFFSLFGGVSFVPVLALVVLLPDVGIYRIPTPWSYLFLTVQGLGVLGVLYGVLQTGALAFLGLAPEPQPARLVTGGVYHWVRHPLYTASLLVLWLAPALSWNGLALNLGVTIYFLVGIQFEERKLRAAFGPAYADYASKTPMLIPGFRI